MSSPKCDKRVGRTRFDRLNLWCSVGVCADAFFTNWRQAAASADQYEFDGPAVQVK